jgi:hypothetical protein
MKILNRFSGETIFEDNAETMRETVLNALKSDANLYGANLYGANLSRANLYGANLSRANLSDANLYGANLYGANLSRANLSDANLSRANLSDANLYGANLSDANLSRANLSRAQKVPMHCRWTHGITGGNLVHIGCEKRTVKGWDAFFKSDEVISTERNTPEFKQIRAVYEAYKAYLKYKK